MPQTKIVLSEKEMQLLSDSTVWHTKQSLTQKLYELLADVESAAKKKHEQCFSSAFNQQYWQSKISRGENYEGCPYLMLDAPNYFSGNDISAIRSMVWYGNYASCFLLLGGNALQQLLPKLSTDILAPYNHELFICINHTPWNHSFTSENMVLLNEFNKSLDNLNFLKLGLKNDISNADDLYRFFIRAYGIYAELIS